MPKFNVAKVYRFYQALLLIIMLGAAVFVTLQTYFDFNITFKQAVDAVEVALGIGLFGLSLGVMSLKFCLTFLSANADYGFLVALLLKFSGFKHQATPLEITAAWESFYEAWVSHMVGWCFILSLIAVFNHLL